jgi:hypothetical protein
LGAHAALFGDGHAMGGAYHALLVQGALAVAVSLGAFFTALAFTQSGATADGSVVASRLRARLPDAGAVIACAGLWYTLAEAVEPQHAAVSPILAIALLAASACLVLRLAVAAARAIAAAVFAICHAAFAPRLPLRRRRPRLRPLQRRPLLARRRFARPPPIVAALRA